MKWWLNQPLTVTAEVFFIWWGAQGAGSAVMVWRELSVSSSPFWVSGIDLGCGQSGTTVVLAADKLLLVCAAFWVVEGKGLLLAWACSSSKIMAVRSPPPLSVCRDSDITLAEPSKDWTVARTPFESRLWKVCSTASGHSAGKGSLPKNRGEGLWGRVVIGSAVQSNYKGHLWSSWK